VRRVFWLAAPAGVVAARCTLTTYLLVRRHHQATAEQHSTAADLTLFVVSVWLLIVIARPPLWWKVLVIAAGCADFLVCLLWEAARDFWARDPGYGVGFWTALGVGAGGCALVELSVHLNPTGR